MSREMRREGGQEGQALIITAFAVLALMGFLALAVDGGNLYLQYRIIQNAADAGALAGAREIALGGPVADPVGKAQEYAVQRNGADTTLVTVEPYTVTVVATKTVPTFFARVLGQPQIVVSASAGASLISVPGGGGYAIWGNNESDSKTVHCSGANITVYGGVHSNAGIHSTGMNLWVYGLLDYVTDWQKNGSNLWIGNPPYESWPCTGCNLWVGEPSPQTTTVQPMPVSYQMSDYQPGGSAAQAAQAEGEYYYHGNKWQISGQNVHVPSGLHYVNGNVKFSGSNLYFDQGPVTIVATGYIRISGCNLLGGWTPYSGGLTLFSTYSGVNAIKTAGSNNDTHGILYAPHSDIEYTGSNSLNGGIIGDKVKLTGSNLTVSYDSSYFPASSRIILSR